jgi:hypothetical protein
LLLSLLLVLSQQRRSLRELLLTRDFGICITVQGAVLLRSSNRCLCGLVSAAAGSNTIQLGITTQHSNTSHSSHVDTQSMHHHTHNHSTAAAGSFVVTVFEGSHLLSMSFSGSNTSTHTCEGANTYHCCNKQCMITFMVRDQSMLLCTLLHAAVACVFAYSNRGIVNKHDKCAHS